MSDVLRPRSPNPPFKDAWAAKEKAGALRIFHAHPSWSVDKITHYAYQHVYPNAGRYPDFYDGDGTSARRWTRIRNWVDYWMHRPFMGAAQRPTVYPDPRPLRSLDVPFAAGVKAPLWPVESTDPRGCDVNYLDVDGTMHGMLFQRFGAPRGAKNWAKDKSRYHIGHDCIANPGDRVVAPEDGKVVAIRPFYAGTDAMYLQTNTGLTLVLGEIENNSGAEFGVGAGSVVQAGQYVARIGSFDLDKQLPFHMLHFETWQGKRDRSANWFNGDPRPADLRNPTDYLLRALCSIEQSFTAAMPEVVVEELGQAVMAQTSSTFKH